MAEYETISNPERIRALAHPVRLALLEHLEVVGEATATECAAAVGESVASCSFHLHTLEKYHFIEPAPRRGRERPWRSTVPTSLDVRPSESVPGSRRAVAELATIQVLRQADRLRAFLASMPSEDEEWVQASTITTSSFWATSDEMAELSRHVENVAAEWFGGREADPSKRPAGARRSHLFAGINPEPDGTMRAPDDRGVAS